MKWTEPEDVERKRWKPKPLPEEPAWPNVRKCACCGADTFQVTNQHGDDVVLDAKPLRIVVGYSEAGVLHPMRETYRLLMIRRIGGYRLHPPEPFYGLVSDEDSADMVRRGLTSDPEWQWYSTSMSIDEAVKSSARIHSEHFYTCPAVSKRAIESRKENCAVTGEAAGNVLLKKLRPNAGIEALDNFYGDDALCDMEFGEPQDAAQ